MTTSKENAIVVCAILAAAGRGARMGQPKQLLQLGGRSLAAWSLEVLAHADQVEAIVIACEPDDLPAFQALAREHGRGKVRAVVPGGARRQDSVFAALRRAPDNTDVVVVHDGARPFVRPDLLRQVIEDSTKSGAAIAAVPVKDTIKDVNEHGSIVRTIPRDRLWAAQTPQAFARDVLFRAHEQAEAAGFVGTDDAEIVERFGGVLPVITPSSYDNLKITTPDDMLIAERILASHAHPM